MNFASYNCIYVRDQSINAYNPTRNDLLPGTRQNVVPVLSAPNLYGPHGLKDHRLDRVHPSVRPSVRHVQALHVLAPFILIFHI
jgi:hypothetical protein